MKALPWRRAKVNLAFSVRVMPEDAAGQDGGNFGGAGGGRQGRGWFENGGHHGVVGCHGRMATIVMTERLA